MSAILAIARKEGRDMAREKTLASAVAVQFVIAAFSAVITVGLAGLYDPESVGAQPAARIAYVGHGATTRLPILLAQESNLRVQPTTSTDAMAGFSTGRYDAVVDEVQGDTGQQEVTLMVADGEIEGILLMTQVKSVLQAYEAGLRDDAKAQLTTDLVQLPPRQGHAPLPFGFLYGVLMPMLLVTPAFVSGAIAGDSLARDLHTGTITLLRAGPLTTRRILWAKLLIPLGLAPIQFLLWAGLFALNGAPVRNLPVLLVTCAALAALWAGVSFAVSARARHPGAAQAGYALAVLVLGAASLWLPRDLVNTLAVVAAGAPDAAAWLSLAVLAGAAAIALPLGMGLAARRIERP